MGRFVVEKTIKMMINQGLSIKNSKVGVLGLTFKEDCPDLRNTRVVDIIEELNSYGTDVLVHDAISDPKEALAYYNVNLCKWDDLKNLSALILAVPHKEYLDKTLSDFKDMLLPNGCLIDVKSIFEPKDAKKLGINFWRL